MVRRWAALRVEIPESLEEPILATLSPGSLGSETRFTAPARCELLFYFEDVDAAAARVPELHAALRALAIDPVTYRVRVNEVADGRWAERWQEGLRPFPLGTRFAVHPSGMPQEGFEERTPILLIPGRAFGTGEHGTTRLAVETLERHVAPGTIWLDLGTGTGLLALVARHLGAGTVVARDNDRDAVEVAREVLEANREETIDLALGSMEGLAPASFDGIAANIVAPFFLAHAPEVAALLRPGGVLLATGLLEEETLPVGHALQQAGLTLEGKESALPWILLVARRRA